MEKKELLFLLFNEIGFGAIAWLLVAGVLFGIAFTYSHFWAIKRFVLKSTHFKGVIFALTFVRLIVFAVALMMAAYPNYSAVRMILFFIGFMIGRVGLMSWAKKEIVS